jgi:hypothetical protein
MNDHLLQQILSYITPLIFITAIAILWVRTRSQALLIALIAEIVGVGFRLVLLVDSSIYISMPMFGIAWNLASLIAGVGLLVYAVETNKPRPPAQGNPP